MLKKYFTFLTAFFAFTLPVFASDAIFSNSQSEQFNLKPLNYSSKPVYSGESIKPVNNFSNVRAQDSALSNKNFINAVNNLDNAQVEIREQLASYNALMAQSKTEYEAKRSEYRQYKKQYNAMKSKLRSIERSKKLIQNNMSQQTYIN